MFPDISFHRTLCFNIFSAWSACAGGENQDGASLPLGDTPQPQMMNFFSQCTVFPAIQNAGIQHIVTIGRTILSYLL